MAVRAPDPALAARFGADLAAALGARPDTRQVIALAVSGGPDSMAMLALAHAALPGGVIAATVDHQLRAESAHEATMVAAYCAQLGVAHATLAPTSPIDRSSLQANARMVRYGLLAGWATAAGARILLTAHHADDQAETFLMRAARGSGLAGLAAIRARREESREVPSLLVVRPLLGWRRTELRALAKGLGAPFVDDPSNDDDRFDRIRFRKLMADNVWLDPVAIAASAAHLAEAERCLTGYLDGLWQQRATTTANGLSVDMHDLDPEMRRRLARRAISQARIRLGITTPQWHESMAVEPLLQALIEHRSATQAGILVTPKGKIWHFSKAPARRSH